VIDPRVELIRLGIAAYNAGDVAQVWRGSGIEIDHHVASLFDVPGERCVYQAVYPDGDRARADAHRREAA
jgi:hypothetical protein